MGSESFSNHVIVFEPFFPFGSKTYNRNMTHGNPIADKTKIDSIIYPPFFLFDRIRPAINVAIATNNPSV